ncbi:MAG: response regulator transcription factor [Akkermansia sp.]
MTPSYYILLAEDEESIRNILRDALEMAGYQVHAVDNGMAAIRFAHVEAFDLALLDVGMPEADGFQVLSFINKERPGVPVIMLTARGEEDDRIKGLKLGADDYIVKPFSMKELIARIEAVLRRSPERPRQQVSQASIPGASLGDDHRTLRFVNGESTVLTSREYELMTYLATHPDRIITREELLRRVWNVDPRLIETRSVEMTIARLREKLKASASVLETFRGQGYRWNLHQHPL